MPHPQATHDLFRINLDFWQCSVAGLACIYMLLLGFTIPDTALQVLTWLVSCFFLTVVCIKARSSRHHHQFATRLTKKACSHTSFTEIQDLCDTHPSDRWIGNGFIWGLPECQVAHEIVSTGWQKAYKTLLIRQEFFDLFIVRFPFFICSPFTTIQTYRASKSRLFNTQGFRWIHALAQEEKQFQPLSETKGHTLLVGTTGAGKTKAFCHFIVQDIARGSTVIVIDPKGDTEMEATMRQACLQYGREEQYVYFHVGHPEKSARINPLANFCRPGELASRITATIPGQGGDGQVFINIGRSKLNAICEGLVYLGERPNLKLLLQYLLSREDLVQRVLSKYVATHFSEQTLADLLSTTDGSSSASLRNLLNFFQDHKPEPDSKIKPILDVVVSLLDLDSEQLMKMISSTIQQIETLTLGGLGELLSPPQTSNACAVDFSDMRTLCQKNSVVYIGLDSLTDATVSRALGSMFLADLTSLAGSIYNYGNNQNASIALYVDEASEVTCEPFIQLLNKGRGAGFVIMAATQTISDFARRSGNEDEANTFLSNLNDVIALRTVDTKTQEFIANKFAETTIKTYLSAHTFATDLDQASAKGAAVSERESEQKTRLIEPQLLGALPNGEFFATVSGGIAMKGRIPLILN